MVGRIDAHHHAKFSRSRSIQIRHIAIFQIFKKSAAAAILDFRNCKILLAIWVERVEMHQHAKLRKNWTFICGDREFSNFQNDCRRHLGLLNLLNFIGYVGGEGRDASARQISLKSVNRL